VVSARCSPLSHKRNRYMIKDKMANGPFRTPPGGARGGTTDIDLLTDAAMTYACNFVEAYYKAANVNRSTLAGFYISAKYSGTEKAILSVMLNGNEMGDGHMIQEIFMKDTPRSHIDVETIDCHILNPHYPPAYDAQKAKTLMSLFIVVGGLYKTAGGMKEEEFHDTLVLIPNPDPAPPRNARNRDHKEYLIESQNFRLVAGDVPG